MIDQLEDLLIAASIRWCEKLQEDFDNGELEQETLGQLVSNFISNADIFIEGVYFDVRS